MSRRWRLGNYLMAAACAAALGLTNRTALSDDDDIVNSFGFELPFTTVFNLTGELEGQINPPGEGQVLPPGQWQRTPTAGTSSAIVQTVEFAPGGGTQAVRVFRGRSNDTRWAVPVNALGYPDYPNPFPPEPAQPMICISWDMWVEPAAGPAGTFGPYFAVEAYDDDGPATGLLASLGVDATTAEVLYQQAGTGVLTPTGATVNYSEWNRFAIELDYSVDQYNIFLNNLMVGMFGFVDPGLNEFSDADIAAVAAAGDAASQALEGFAYFDNFLVREGACMVIPEPAAGLAMALGCCLAAIAARKGSIRTI